MKRIISAAMTPFTDDGKLDLDSAARLYEFGISAGLDGFFFPGTMGEWATMTQSERAELAKAACDIIGKRARVLLSISDLGLASILENADRFSSFSHDAYVIVLPSGPGAPADPVACLHKIADNVDRPIYVYYVPGANNIRLTTAQFADLMAHPNIAGLKNSAGEIRTRKELLVLKRTLPFELYEGEEWAIDEALMLGCDGAIAGFGSVGARLMTSLVAQFEAGDVAAAMESQRTLIDIYHRVFRPAVRWWCAGQKYALNYLGIIASDRCRLDGQQGLPEEERADIRKCIDQYREQITGS